MHVYRHVMYYNIIIIENEGILARKEKESQIYLVFSIYGSFNKCEMLYCIIGLYMIWTVI